MTFEIERGVQIPVVAGRVAQRVQYPFASMGLGDSFFVPCDGDQKARDALRSRILHAASVHRNEAQADFAITTRMGEKDGKEGVRVWRTEYREPAKRNRGTPLAVIATPPPRIGSIDRRSHPSHCRSGGGERRTQAPRPPAGGKAAHGLRHPEVRRRRQAARGQG